MTGQNKFGLGFHDSQLESVVRMGDSCSIAFRPAYVYEVIGESGEIGPCMTVDVKFEFEDGSVDGVLGDLPCPILDGSLCIDSVLVEHLVTVPFDGKGAIIMSLNMWPDYREIVITAQGVSIRLEGVPRLE